MPRPCWKARGQLPLHSAVQLLLTTVHATRPEVYQHALVSMALAGALSAAAGQARFDLRMALLTGLLHDMGEMYLDPRYLDNSQPLDAAGYRHVVTHPLIGRMLLLKLTEYPPELADAVAEHHERLDGTGYPARKLGAALSPLGRMQAVVEAAVGMVASARVPLARTALALAWCRASSTMASSARW
jgi:HD-GYP domain-containing protein (c-di-GMP phosphodiesterase class II)